VKRKVVVGLRVPVIIPRITPMHELRSFNPRGGEITSKRCAVLPFGVWQNHNAKYVDCWYGVECWS